MSQSQIEAAMQLIKSKKTFHQGIEQLLAYIANTAAGAAACARQSEIQHETQPSMGDGKGVMQAIARCMSLLKSRYTSPVYWKAVLDLVNAATPIMRHQPEYQQALHQYTCDIKAFLGDGDDDLEEEPQVPVQNNSFLFEGQLSEEPDHTRSGPGALYHLEQQLLRSMGDAFTHSNGTATEHSTAQPTDHLDDGTHHHHHPRTMPQLGLSPEALQQLLEVASHLALFTEDAGWGVEGVDPTRPRPASKKVVRNMRRIRLTEEALVKLGHASMECPVCMEGYVSGDTVVIMPCNGKHVFHPACLNPWLEHNNSCPMCRHELPTDDEAYERYKAREQRAAEEAVGAEDAVRGGEFMYM